MLIAFPREGGRGTQNAIEYALRRGLEVWQVPCGTNVRLVHPATGD